MPTIVGAVLPPLETRRINQFWWLTDGRLIYAKNETQGIRDISNFWAARLDGHTGEPLEKPERLTNWSGFGIGSISATKDSRRLAFLQRAFNATIYIADLEADEVRVRYTRHFTLTESKDVLEDWAPDSKSVIFLSNRTGRPGVYKQLLNSETPELIESGEVAHPRVTPDGKWVVYVLDSTATSVPGPLQLVRVPITGGAAQSIFPARSGSLPLCTRPPYNICAIAEPSQDGRQIILTAFDPLRARGSELIRLNIDPAVNWNLDLSPDGTRLAALTNPTGPLRIISLRGQPVEVIHPRVLNNLQFVHWAANGRGLYVFTGARNGRALWHLDLRGNSNLLWENRGGYWAPGLPSPDGRHMAIQSSDRPSNVWMIEDF